MSSSPPAIPDPRASPAGGSCRSPQAGCPGSRFCGLFPWAAAAVQVDGRHHAPMGPHPHAGRRSLPAEPVEWPDPVGADHGRHSGRSNLGGRPSCGMHEVPPVDEDARPCRPLPLQPRFRRPARAPPAAARLPAARRSAEPEQVAAPRSGDRHGLGASWPPYRMADLAGPARCVVVRAALKASYPEGRCPARRGERHSQAAAELPPGPGCAPGRDVPAFGKCGRRG